ncbi:hypothetical protein BKD30_12370 [Tersicoccus phoenicis]|uniref:Antitoxin n=1 Tax=Tersicoccus phoenicis TaxID=554083 RepID=A0A1R1L7E7_9MICC|nr:hypothetical protein BKD30_12370 [Tersicoccus phoenicis]
MGVIPLQELCEHGAEVLRKVEAGEDFTVVVDGRPVAELVPVGPRRWVKGPELARVWDASPAQHAGDGPEPLGAELVDPLRP